MSYQPNQEKTVIDVSGEINPKVRSVSGNETLLNTDTIILATSGSSDVTLTLPAPKEGKLFYIKKIDSDVGSVIITTPSLTVIDGFTTAVIASQYECITIVSDGINYFII